MINSKTESCRSELTTFSFVVLALVGRGGAGPHDLVRMMRSDPLYWAGSESQYLRRAETPREARLPPRAKGAGPHPRAHPLRADRPRARGAPGLAREAGNLPTHLPRGRRQGDGRRPRRPRRHDREPATVEGGARRHPGADRRGRRPGGVGPWPQAVPRSQRAGWPAASSRRTSPGSPRSRTSSVRATIPAGRNDLACGDARRTRACRPRTSRTRGGGCCGGREPARRALARRRCRSRGAALRARRGGLCRAGRSRSDHRSATRPCGSAPERGCEAAG